MTWLWIFGIALLAALIGLFGFTFSVALRLVRPPRRLTSRHPRDLAAPFEEVRIPGPAGLLAAGYLPGTNGRTLIALHGIADNRQQWLAPAVDLQRRGFGSLLLDLRAHGESGGRHVTFGHREVADVAAALDYLEQRGDVDVNRVGVVGLSLGGIVAIMAAASLPALRAVATEAAFPDLLVDLRHAFRHYTGLPPFPLANLTVIWGQMLTGTRLSRLRAIEVVDRIAPRPIFIISDLADSIVPEPRASEELFARAKEPKEFWQLPDTDHVQGYNRFGADYIDRLEAFFARSL